MADYIKLRMSAAKAGVTLALLALLGGLAERSRAESPPTASQSSLNFLKLTGISSAISGNLVKLEKKIVKIDTSLAKIERSLPQTYLKIKSANTDFLKIRSANASFLKIDDANAQYLKIEGTAQNANELGGLTSTQFVHGTGAIGTGAVTFAQGAFSEQTLLQFPGTNGAIIVVCIPQPGASLRIVVRNNTQTTISAVQDDHQNGDKPVQLAPGDTTLATLTQGPSQLHLQTFPPSGSTSVWTLTVSGEIGGSGGTQVVGQILNGDG